MKILAIETERIKVDWETQNTQLIKEARHVYNLYQEQVIREIYFNQSKNAVLILECRDKNEAHKILNDFPLVKQGLIDFNIMELNAYTGFSRLFES